jgi:hypothetical protein
MHKSFRTLLNDWKAQRWAAVLIRSASHRSFWLLLHRPARRDRPPHPRPCGDSWDC